MPRLSWVLCGTGRKTGVVVVSSGEVRTGLMSTGEVRDLKESGWDGSGRVSRGAARNGELGSGCVRQVMVRAFGPVWFGKVGSGRVGWYPAWFGSAVWSRVRFGAAEYGPGRKRPVRIWFAGVC